MQPHRWGRRRWLLAVGVAAAAATGAVLVVRAVVPSVAPPPPACTIGSGAEGLLLAPEQAENAATIAAVGRRLALPVDAVTVALTTALQESKLHNYPFGDRDSLGLFQQRPSQGWGRPAQLLTPAYAAAAFYRHLAAVPRWRRLPVAVAAQEVQRSADGTAYAQWEEQARAMATVLSGQLPAGLTCRFDRPGRPQPAALAALAARELGRGVLARTSGSAARDWTTAAWLVAHARTYGVAAVTTRDRRWSRQAGRWSSVQSSAAGVHYVMEPRAR